MRIAILGATSEIAKDLICSFEANENYELSLFSRRPQVVQGWLDKKKFPKKYTSQVYESFSIGSDFDALINFVGVGNPAQAAAVGASIFDVTQEYDEMALNYLRHHPNCKYIFLSSGAAYGSNFNSPVDEKSNAFIEINRLKPQDWYGISKLYAEGRHRSLAYLPIVDIRVFNYYSHTQSIDSRFLIADIVRAIRDKKILITSSDFIVRDFIGRNDFYQLVKKILVSTAKNDVVDCYSKATIDKPSLLKVMGENFGLQYEFGKAPYGVDATGIKSHYYSLNRRAQDFGYCPTLSSLEVLLMESEIFLRDS
jgi:nucleoside-diphosphate-sugar epimerase